MASRGKARTNLTRDTFLALLKTAGDLERQVAELLRERDLSVTQYNVLRILRGSGDTGATCGQIGERLIKHDPDVTRLLDRLERAALVERTRDPEDRRVVRTSITRAGLALLGDLEAPIDELHRRQMGHMSDEALDSLCRLLGVAASGSG